MEHRVREIQSLTSPAQWRHCSSSNNPADVATRGISVNQLKENSLWWTGPIWLKQGEIYFCEHEPEPHVSVAVVNESVSVMEVAKLTGFENTVKMELLELKNYSDLNRVLHVTAWIKRFIYNAKEKTKRL